ncbi:MAG: CU044_2847 family protein [Candidatus Electrothrix gigas]
MKKLVEFNLNGQPIYVETEISEQQGIELVSRGKEDEPEKATDPFEKVISRIKPTAELVLNSFKEMNSPDEIELEFGLKFNAKTGVIFASADSEATFKVSLKWSNKE